MGQEHKRASTRGEDDSGQHKKRQSRDNWQHYEVSGEFNACMDNPDKKNKSSNEESDKICIDGNLKGDAHVNSQGLIVGEAEVHNSYNDIDVNFEMQANKKHKDKRDPPQSQRRSQSPQGPSAPHQTSSESDQTPPHSGLPEQSSASRQELTPSASASEATTTGGNNNENETPDENENEKSQSNEGGSDSAERASEDSERANDEAMNEYGSSSESVKKEGSRSSSTSNESITFTSTQVNQAPFIQKLYAMLEDPKLQHVIRWAPSHDRFYINPNEEFSQILCLYFKHTNISSFVRQLSMYGFHKIANAGHNRDKWYPWEFRHMDGAFRRGDIDSLRNIKRRSTRQITGKRVKYVTIVNGDGAKQKPSPTLYPAQAIPATATPQPQPPAHQVHQSQIPQPQPQLQPQPQPQPLIYGQDPNALAPAGSVPDREQAMRLLRMHQGMQSQLHMVQETMSRLSQSMGEMGAVIDQFVSRVPHPMAMPQAPHMQPITPHHQLTFPQHPTPVPALDTPGTSSSSQYMSMSEPDAPIQRVQSGSHIASHPSGHLNGHHGGLANGHHGGHPSGHPNGHPNGHLNGHPSEHLNGQQKANLVAPLTPQPLVPQPLPPQIAQEDVQTQNRFGLRTLLN